MSYRGGGPSKTLQCDEELLASDRQVEVVDG